MNQRYPLELLLTDDDSRDELPSAKGEFEVGRPRVYAAPYRPANEATAVTVCDPFDVDPALVLQLQIVAMPLVMTPLGHGLMSSAPGSPAQHEGNDWVHGQGQLPEQPLNLGHAQSNQFRERRSRGNGKTLDAGTESRSNEEMEE